MEIGKSLQDIKDEYEKKIIESKISKIDESVIKGKILITISGVGSFVLISVLFFYLLSSGNRSDSNISAVLSLLAGFFAAFLIMAVGGIVREFSIKSGFIDITSKLQEKIENVQTDVQQSKKEIEDKISNLNQNLNSTILQSALNMRQNSKISVNSLSEDRIMQLFDNANKQFIKEVKSFNYSNISDAPIAEGVVTQKTPTGE